MLWKFIGDNAELINENMFKLDKIRGGIFYGTWELFGHDLALSQNGHGTGFCGRGYGIIGDKLQEAAEKLGNVYLLAI